MYWGWQHRFIEWEKSGRYWLAIFLIEDLVYYILHYADHHCRMFWAVHVPHHSSEEFNLTTGFRSSVFQPLYRTAYFVPIALLGFAPLDILLMYRFTAASSIPSASASSAGWSTFW